MTTAQIAAAEAEHRALVRQIGKRLANNQSYAQYQFNNVSDAVPVLLPFLDGSGEGFVGLVAPPSADDVAAIQAETEMPGYDDGVCCDEDVTGHPVLGEDIRSRVCPFFIINLKYRI